MTINKIALSVLAASTLATASFAAANSISTTGKIEYNTAFTSTQPDQALGVKIGQVDLNTSTPINNKNVVYVKIEGAKWAGDPSKYVLSYLDNGTATTVDSANITNDEIQFIVSGTIAKDTNLSVTYNGNGGSDLNVTLPSTYTGDVVISTRARDNENGIDLAGAEDSITVAKPVTVTPTATVTCANVTIDSDNKTQFLTGSKNTVTTADCDIAVIHPSKDVLAAPAAGYTNGFDFDYTDVNATVYMYPGNFTDGNFTAAVDSSNVPNGTLGASDAVTGQAINFYLGDNDLSDDINSTLTYTLSGTGNELADATFQTEVKLGYVGDAVSGVAPEQTPFTKADTMTWTLPVFSVTVLNMRSNPTNGTNTFIKLYNDDASQVASVDVQVTTADGRILPTVKDVATVPSQGSITLSASQINDAVTSENLANGYAVKVSYSNVAKTSGNAVAYQRNSEGSTMGMRVKTNRVVGAGYYQGL